MPAGKYLNIQSKRPSTQGRIQNLVKKAVNYYRKKLNPETTTTKSVL